MGSSSENGTIGKSMLPPLQGGLVVIISEAEIFMNSIFTEIKSFFIETSVS